MYADFFELKRRPFSSTPDPAGFFAAPTHEEALVLLKFCVKAGDGIGVIIGPPGVGKTLLCHMLIDAFDKEQASALITNTHMTSVHSMLQAIAYDLCLPFDDLAEQELRLRLTQFIMEQYAQGRQVLLVVDEAQNLSLEQLEELRLLTNLEGRNRRAVQLVLAGQERLGETLKSELLESFRQRIAVVASLSPLDLDQSIEYIRAQMAHAGGSADTIFTADALSEICEHARGIPRRINQIAYRSLLLAHASESGTVDAPHVRAAVAQWSKFDSSRATRQVSHSPPGPFAPSPAVPGRADTVAPFDGAEVVEVGADYPARRVEPSKNNFEPRVQPSLVLEPESSAVSHDEHRQRDSLRGTSRMRQLYAR